MIQVDVFRLNQFAPLPNYGTSLSSCFDLGFYPAETNPVVIGYDLYNAKVEKFVTDGKILINPGDRLLVPTGLVFKIKEAWSIESFADITREREELRQYSIRLHPRSGLSLKHGLVLANCEGIVDVDYQQQIYVLLTNISGNPATINVGDRIAQGEIVTNEEVNFVEVTEFPSQHSERNGGFGSTGR